MSNPWDPPVDASGGYFVLEYIFGAFQHSMRLHVAPYDRFSFAYNVAHGTETSVEDTIANYVDVLKAFYTANWQIGLRSLWASVSGVFAPVPIPPVFVPVNGTHSSGEAERADLEETFTIPTAAGHKAKIIMIASAALAESVPSIFTSASGGAAGALMGYLSGANTGIVAHDGSALLDYAKASVSQNRRLTRRYHFN